MPPRPHALEPIYLDHAAATPLDADVDAAIRAATAMFGNPSSLHAAGRRARAALEDARDRIVSQFGGRSLGTGRDRFVFTSGATEANRLGMLGTAGRVPGTVAVSPRDHASVAAAARSLAERGWRIVEVPLAPDGTTAAGMERLMADEPAGRLLVCTTLVCGQTGLRDTPPTPDRSRLLVHADATQAAAWDPIAFCNLPVTSLAVAPHKFGGPRGIGGVFLRGDVGIEPVVAGPQELGLRGGTEPVALAVGFAVAVERAVANRDRAVRHVTALRDRFEAGLVAAAATHGFEGFVVGREGDRAPHVSTVAIRGCDRQSLAMACDLAGVCLSTGTACASGSSDPSPAVVALGLPAWVASSAIRASLAASTTRDDVDAALRRIDGVFRGFAATGLQSSSLPG